PCHRRLGELLHRGFLDGLRPAYADGLSEPERYAQCDRVAQQRERDFVGRRRSHGDVEPGDRPTHSWRPRVCVGHAAGDGGAHDYHSVTASASRSENLRQATVMSPAAAETSQVKVRFETFKRIIDEETAVAKK